MGLDIRFKQMEKILCPKCGELAGHHEVDSVIGNWIQPAKAWFCLGVPFKVTHWMPLPNPPKEVDK